VCGDSAPVPHKPVTEYIVYVGTYSVRGSQGIYAYRWDAGSGSVTSLGLQAETTNASFLVLSPDCRFLYAVSETGEFGSRQSGSLLAYSIDRRTGALTMLNEVASLGAGPCFVSLDKTGKFVLTANFHGGSVAVFRVQKDGSLGAASAIVPHHGSSIHPDRQRAPHPHAVNVSPDNRYVLAADLGLDRIFSYRFDSCKGSLVPNHPPFTLIEPGSGPRHFEFHPKGRFVYVVNEIKSTVMTFAYDKSSGGLHSLQTISTVAGFRGQADAAELQLDPAGRFLYISNRGPDDIRTFSIDASSGMLTAAGGGSSGGTGPRHFAIDPGGRYLFAANEASDAVVIFSIDSNTGRLTASGRVLQVASPACFVFLPIQH